MAISNRFTGLLPTPQAIDGQGEGRPLRLKKDMKRNPDTPGSWRGDLKDHITMMNMLLPTPQASDQYNANTKDGHDMRKGYLRDITGHIMKSTCSQAPLPANPQAPQESEKARQTLAGSGRSTLESLAKLNRSGSSQRMFWESLILRGAFHSSKCALTWKLKATKSGRPYCQLQVSTPRTSDTGFGLSGGGSIATPTVTDASDGIRKSTQQKEGSRHSVTLKDDIMRLPMTRTPSASDGEGGVMEIRPETTGHYKLRDEVANLLPTPAVRDIKGANSPEHLAKPRGHHDQLPNALAMLPTPQTRDFRSPDSPDSGNYQRKTERGFTIDLNSRVANLTDTPTGTQTVEQSPTRPAGRMRLSPEFTEWMMGLKRGYTSLSSTESD